MKTGNPVIILFALILFLFYGSFAQDFKYEADIPKVSVKGWYKIILNPSVTGEAGKDLGTLRLFDSLQHEVPFKLICPPFEIDDSENFIFQSIENYSIEKTQDPNSNKTVITLRFLKPQWIHRMSWKISSPQQYHREARLSYEVVNKYRRKNKRYDNYLNLIFDSRDSSYFDFYGIYTDELILKIENKDDVALEFQELVPKQRSFIIVADLEPKQCYKLKFGGEQRRRPEYDISYFIPDEKKLPFLYVLSLQANNADGRFVQSAEGHKKILPSWMLWGGLFTALAIIIFLSWKLISEMQKKKLRQ